MGSWKYDWVYEQARDTIINVFKDVADCISAQVEIGGEQGYKHVQFFIKTKKPCRFTELRSHMIDMECQLPIWLRGVNGTDKVEHTKCIRYCQKQDSTTVENTNVLIGFTTGADGGAPSKQGKRTDMTALRAYILQKKGSLDILSEELDNGLLSSIAQYPKFVDKLIARAMGSAKRPAPLNFCFWGDTGTGKTARAHLLAKELGYQPHQVYVKQAMTQWWDGYDPCVHRVVIVDEMRPLPKELTAMYLSEMNQGQVTAQQVKGGMVPLMVDVWIFTSPFHPDSWIWCPEGTDKSQQFVRRFGPHIYHYTKPFIHPEQIEKVHELPDSAKKVLLE